MSFEATPTLRPLQITGQFSLSTEDLQLAFSKIFEAGHEAELVLMVKLFLAFDMLPEHEKAKVVSDAFELVRKSKISITPEVTLERKGKAA